MERADAGKGPVKRVARHEDMPHLRVRQAVEQAAFSTSGLADKTAANAGADGEVEQRALARFQPGPGAPTGLGEGGAVHIGVDGDRAAKGLGKWRDEIGVGPVGLWCAGDEAPRGGCGRQVEGAKGADADTRKSDALPRGFNL